MRHLARAPRHHLSLVRGSTADRGRSPRHARGLLAARDRSAHRRAKGTWRFYADAAGYVVDSVPYAVAKYRSAAYRARVEDCSRRGFDAVVCDFLPPVVNLPERLPCPAILFTHNVEAEIWRRHAEQAANPLSKYLMTQQWQRMLRFEARALSRFDLVLAVSEADGRTFARLYPEQPARPGARRADRRRDRLLHAVGDRARPHAHGLHRLDGLAAERRRHDLFLPRDPSRRSARPSPSHAQHHRAARPRPRSGSSRRFPASRSPAGSDDVRPHIARGAVYVVPLRIGGGTRLKIFEAMSMAKAVVSTTGRRRGAAGDQRSRHRPRRRTGALRACRRAPDARHGGAPVDRGRRRASS
jgi:hypothetical protein